MLYFIVHLAVNVNASFTYMTPAALCEGCRVLVNFHHKDVLGICGKRVLLDAKDTYKMKPIIEILDESPIFSPNQLELAHWIADYYHCPVGKVLSSMLPSILQPEISNEVKLLNTYDNEDCSIGELPRVLNDMQWHKISELRTMLPHLPILKMIELGEAEGVLEIKRSLRKRGTPRTVNYIEIIEQDIVPNLTDKQAIALSLIKSKTMPFPLSEVSDEVSYSIIKALVNKGLIRMFPRKIKNIILPDYDKIAPKQITLTTEQMQAIANIIANYDSPKINLLYGITGSGKTEVYIEVIKHYLTQGKGVIFLIPEIALTPQMVERFYCIFGQNMAIMHSQLSDRERYQQWKMIADGKCQIVIGARSAVFVPIQNLGLIIVDEEHEHSYKQDKAPRYNGRDVAIVRAKIENAQVILGSATPSLESWLNATTSRYQLHILKNRPDTSILPTVKIVNMCDEESNDLFSAELKSAIIERLERKEQVILFQNRRGYSSFVQCHKCGELLKCTNCEISMYYHRDREELHCHYCGNSLPVPRKCPHCNSFTFSYGAAGTQKVEQLLHIHFPTAKVLRLDSDSGAKKNIYKLMHDRMKGREIDILLGTQMIAKGLDFPGVTLVGVINADISLNVPDFRASERTFQLLTQVAGRSGRGEMHGEVIIQTYNPTHYAIDHASKQDFTGFAEEELSYRKRLQYPPYYRLARIVFQSPNREHLIDSMTVVSIACERLQNSFPREELIVMGPSPAPNVKVNKNYRYHLIFKALNPQVMSSAIQFILGKAPSTKGITSSIDIDPISLL